MLTKTESFNALGYPYSSTRGVWSAEREGGVLVTVWQRNIRWSPSFTGDILYVDMDELHPPGSEAREELNRNGKLRRLIERLDRAYHNPGLYLDVVVLFGEIGNGSGNALPWLAGRHDARAWKVIRAVPETGSYRIEAHRKRMD